MLFEHHLYARQNNMWILDRLEIARQQADLMFGSIAEDGSLGTMYYLLVYY